MPKIKEYVLVTNTDIDEFNNLIGKSLADGWEIYGFPAIAKNASYNRYIQAVVRYAPLKKARKKS